MKADCCAMPMPGQSWPLAAMSFVGMWILMMVPMMLPVLVPSLMRYRRAVGGGWWVNPLTALAGSGYFLVWTAIGVLLYPVTVALAAVQARAPALAGALPIAAGMVVVVAGFMQITAWKARGIACCREAPEPGAMSPDAITAWRHGVRLGMDCLRCCGNLMAVLLALGMMDLRWMAAVTAAITVERIAPPGVTVARVIGVVVILWGVVLMVRASGLS